MNEYNSVTAASIQLSAGAVAVTLLLFIILPDRTPSLWYPLVWLCFGPILYGADRLFLRQDRTVQALFLLNGCAGVTLFLLLLLLDGWWGMWALLFTGAGCAALSAQAATLCTQAPKLSSVVQWLDVELVLLAVFAAYLGELGLSMLWAIPAAVGCGAAILGTLVFRAGGRLPPRGWCFATVLLAALAGGVWLSANTISKGAGQGLLALGNALKAAGTAFCTFVMWLISLLPQQQYGELELGEETAAVNAVAPSEQIEFTVPWFVYVLLVLLALTALVLLLRYLRRFRVSGAKLPIVPAMQKPRRSQISLWSALNRKLDWLMEGVRLRLYLHRKRDTALGAFYGLLRCAYGRSWREGAEESPREFLIGLSRRAGEDEALCAALAELIPAVERALYAPGGDEEPYSQAALLRNRRTTLFPRQTKRRLLGFLYRLEQENAPEKG